jgi:hypothetical protein
MNTLPYLKITAWRRHFVFTVWLLISLLFQVSGADAQSNWNFTFRAGASIPTSPLGQTKLNPGLGAEGFFSYRFQSYFSMYAGWSLNRFSASHSFAGEDVTFEETGYLVGLRMIQPLGAQKTDLIIGVGSVYNRLEVLNHKGDLIGGTAQGMGWQLEAGLLFPFGKKLIASPGIRYRVLPANIMVGGSETPATLKYLFASIGLLHNF